MADTMPTRIGPDDQDAEEERWTAGSSAGGAPDVSESEDPHYEAVILVVESMVNGEPRRVVWQDGQLSGDPAWVAQARVLGGDRLTRPVDALAVLETTVSDELDVLIIDAQGHRAVAH